MENLKKEPSPEMIMQIGTGFWASKILLTAVKFQLFTLISQKGSMSASEIKSTLKLNCADRHLFDFLDILTSFGFLKRSGLLENAKYSNSVDTETFLNKGKPSYIGDLLEMMNNRLYGFWGNLDEALTTGLAQNEAKSGGENLFDVLDKNPVLLKEFVNAMTSLQVGNFMKLTQTFDFSKYNTFLDVGGSAGVLSVMVARHYPQIKCTTFDRPSVEPIANETIQSFQLADRVKAVSGDFFAVELPKSDVITMGNILHDWNEENKVRLIQKAYDALPDGGAFIAIEAVIDNDRKQNTFGMMMSLNMLIESPDGEGFDYTFDDFNRWTEQVGFKSTAIIPLTGPSSAAIAYK
ncbi:methyltransferase [Dapis sp. BLCC M172]|uniref:methyltransferase n=1 Tax=Dapis sp. BLCC M172 TaxID=2975281 RepID=UPI003CF9A2A4